MWVKPESLGANNNILFCKNGTSSTDCHIYFSIISTTQLNLGVNGPSSSVTATGQTFTTGTWYHVAATYDGTTATIYLNGIELKHGTVTTACPTGRLNMNINGRSTNTANTGTTGNITCSFNDFRLYDNCLSAAEVREIA
jgi:predicted amino acid dehydrogenase